MTTNPVPGSLSPDQSEVADLIHAAADGDRVAWAELIRRYTPLVVARMRPYRLQEADRLDVAQTTWLRLAENLARLHTPGHLGGWLATVVARECQQICRVNGRASATGDLMTSMVADPAVGPEQSAVEADIARRLWGAVAELSAARAALVRALFADATRSYAEISRDTGIPIGGIGPTRGRALRELRALLGDEAAGLVGA
jgi:RNA polymerase sigma factor (sigma-70 family)